MWHHRLHAFRHTRLDWTIHATAPASTAALPHALTRHCIVAPLLACAQCRSLSTRTAVAPQSRPSAASTPASGVSTSSAFHPSKRARTIPASLEEDATEIAQAFEFYNSRGAAFRKPTFLRPESKPQLQAQPPPVDEAHALLSDAVSSLESRHFAVRKPCHPTSLFSLPVLNQLRAILHSRAFVKMVIRASLNAHWRVEPSWDFNAALTIPEHRQHPNWVKHQELIYATASSPSTMGKTDEESANGESVTAAKKIRFTCEQVDGNVNDFILSPYLHQSREIYQAVLGGQHSYFELADRMAKEYGALPVARYRTAEKKLKKELSAAWKHMDADIHRALVNQFVKFMEEPIGEDASPADTPGGGDAESLNAAISRTRQQSTAQLVDSLLKSRSGRLRFDPTLVGLSNLSAPHEWYELARGIPRKFIVHVGPTNSGKVSKHHAHARAQARLYLFPPLAHNDDSIFNA